MKILPWLGLSCLFSLHLFFGPILFYMWCVCVCVYARLRVCEYFRGPQVEIGSYPYHASTSNPELLNVAGVPVLASQAWNYGYAATASRYWWHLQVSRVAAVIPGKCFSHYVTSPDPL